MKINYHQLSIKQIHDLLISKLFSPSQLTTFACQRMKKWAILNGTVTTLESKALKQAKLLDKMPIDSNNLLMAIPFMMKDNIITIDTLTTASSAILAHFVPNYDSTVNQLLTDTHAINIAKTTMDELGMGGDGLYAASGIVHNPWNHDHITGGSSSGSAALVAAGVVPFALGTDTGDSIRLPAAYCGIIGFKPTYGLISRNGVIPYAPSLDTVGLFANHVSDIAIVLDAIVKFDKNDFTSVKSQETKYYHNLSDDLKNKNIAILNYDDYQWTNEVKTAFDQALDDLTGAGAKIHHYNFPQELLTALLPTYMIISFAEATSCHANLDGINFGVRKEGKDYQAIMTNSRTAGLGDMVKKRYMLGAYALAQNHQAESFNKAKQIRRLIADELALLFKKYDAFIVMPSVSGAPKIKTILAQKQIIKTQDHFCENLLLLANFNGGPSITIPLTMLHDLPIGININSAPFKDQTALNIADFLSKKINFNNKLLGDDNE